MSDKTEYNRLLNDLQRYAEDTQAPELQKLVQRALIAMAFDMADKEAAPVKPLTKAHAGFFE